MPLIDFERIVTRAVTNTLKAAHHESPNRHSASQSPPSKYENEIYDIIVCKTHTHMLNANNLLIQKYPVEVIHPNLRKKIVFCQTFGCSNITEDHKKNIGESNVCIRAFYCKFF